MTFIRSVSKALIPVSIVLKPFLSRKMFLLNNNVTPKSKPCALPHMFSSFDRRAAGSTCPFNTFVRRARMSRGRKP